jgi:hypothetical protein
MKGQVMNGKQSAEYLIQREEEVKRLKKEIADFRIALEHEKTIGARRAFIFGAKWWQAHQNGATAFASECDEMDREALKRYGLPQTFSS